MSLEDKKINSILIIEVLGKPKEHLVETLENIANEISKEKGVELDNKKIHEPIELENQNGIYSSFMEIEINVDNVLYLAMLMFKYMPSSIEVIEPERITLTNNNIGEILSEITRTMHKYDEVVRVLSMEKKILENKLNSIKEQIEKKDDKKLKVTKTKDKKN